MFTGIGNHHGFPRISAKQKFGYMAIPILIISAIQKSGNMVSAIQSLQPILGQVWYLIVSIPDLCTLTYFI